MTIELEYSTMCMLELFRPCMGIAIPVYARIDANMFTVSCMAHDIGSSRPLLSTIPRGCGPPCSSSACRPGLSNRLRPSIHLTSKLGKYAARTGTQPHPEHTWQSQGMTTSRLHTSVCQWYNISHITKQSPANLVCFLILVPSRFYKGWKAMSFQISHGHWTAFADN